MIKSSLIEVNDPLFLAIYIQPHFIRKESESEHNPLLQRMCWVIKVAKWCNVPLIITAEDISNTGNVSDEVAEILPPNTKIYNKMTFGLAAQPDILEAVQDTQRKTTILIGYETDVCGTFSLGITGFRI